MKQKTGDQTYVFGRDFPYESFNEAVDEKVPEPVRNFISSGRYRGIDPFEEED